MGYSSTIHSNSMMDMGTFTDYRLHIISIFKNSQFTENICNFAQNAKKLHNEQGRYKQIENSSCRTKTYSKVVSRTNRSRPCHCLKVVYKYRTANT